MFREFKLLISEGFYYALGNKIILYNLALVTMLFCIYYCGSLLVELVTLF
jgi:hypothetical protein